MSSLNGKPLKLVDPFIYLGSNISSTESNVNIRIGQVWTAIDRLLHTWKFDHSNKIIQFFQAVVMLVLLYDCTNLTNKMPGENTRWELHNNATCSFEQILEATPYKTAVVQPLTSHLTKYPRMALLVK